MAISLISEGQEHVIPDEPHLVLRADKLHKPGGGLGRGRRLRVRVRVRVWLRVGRRLLERVNAFSNVFEILINEPSEVVQVKHVECMKAFGSGEALKHKPRHLFLPVVLSHLLQLVIGLGDPLPQKRLLVHLCQGKGQQLVLGHSILKRNKRVSEKCTIFLLCSISGIFLN